MNGDDLIALVSGLLVIGLFLSWPVLPGLRRLRAHKAFPPFRAWAARPHPDAVVPVRAGRRVDLSPDDTSAANATVVVRTAWGKQHSRDLQPSLRVSRPQVPLVSVDGAPASWGWGTTKLTLPPGEHLIAVSTSHSRCYQAINAGRGERVDLEFTSVIGAVAHRHREAGNAAYDLTSFRRTRSGPGSLGWYYLIVLAGFVIIGGSTAFAVADPSGFSAAVENAAVVGAVGVGLGIGVAVIAASLVKQARQRKITAADTPADGAPEGPRVLDADRPERLAPAPGWAALGLHLRFEIEEYTPETIAALSGGEPSPMQRWRAIRIGEPEAPACRPWIPAPEVLVDGNPVRAGWTRMWMQLPPGEHELEVRVPATPGQTGPETAVDLSRAVYRTRFQATPGQTTAVNLCADVTAVPATDRPRLAEYRVRLR